MMTGQTLLKITTGLRNRVSPRRVRISGDKIFAALISVKDFFSSPLPPRITPRAVARIVIALIIFSCVTSYTALAANEEEKTPRLETAEIIVCPNAKNAATGSPLDEYYLARAYDKGYCGFAIDGKLAEEWYLRAAKHKHMLAQYELGEIYFTGRGMDAPDYPKAKKWHLEAARKGHGLSQLRLGFLYAEAHFKGLKTDYTEAEKWFTRAAEQDAGDARFRLGNFYRNYKKPPDPGKALLWLTKAAEGGHRVAMFDLARMLLDANRAKEGVSWMTKAAEMDYMPAQISLSEMYENGHDAPKDPAQSLFWTMKIALNEAAPVYWTNRAADAFFAGADGIRRDDKEAFRLYSRAAEKEDPHALSRLGQMYAQGRGVEKDEKKAQAYLQKAAARGDSEAQDILSRKGNAP